MFFGFQYLPPEAIKQLKEMYPDEFKNSKEGEIKKEIEKLYLYATFSIAFLNKF